MHNTVKAMIGYWRKSLLDGAPVAGILKQGQLDVYWPITRDVFAQGCLSEELLCAWQKKLERNKKETGDLALIPFVYQRRAKHGAKLKDEGPEFVIPLYLPCSADQEGVISPQGGLPLIPRELLEPLDDFDGLVIGSMDDFSKAVDEVQLGELKENEQGSLMACLELGRELLEHVAPGLNGVMEAKGYKCLEGCYVLPDFQTSMAGKIITLCDCILRNIESDKAQAMPLLTTLGNGERRERPLPDLGASFSTRLGYPSRMHALADNQRLAAACLLETREGEVLAVNGPPGTGKTAVLLSLIATEYVRAVLQGDTHPPLIVAASTNNQAVTNILDGFAEIPSDEGVFQRWIPRVKSFGSYYPSSGRKDEAERAGRHTEVFFEEGRKPEVRASDVAAFLTACREYFGETIALAQAPERIKERLVQEQGKLVAFHNTYADLETRGKALKLPAEGLGEEVLHRAYGQIQKCLDEWRQTYARRSWVEKYFAWLRSSIRKRLEKRMHNIYEEYWPKEFREAFAYPGLADFSDDGEEFRLRVKRYREAAQECRRLVKEWTGKELEELSLLAADRLFDATLRRTLFWLSVHYWEARWLLEIKTPRDSKWYSSPEGVIKEWHQRMMLTPCAVATFHQLAGLLTIWRRPLAPLYNGIDLLIVEEAGQVAPEIAGPSFALAKRAVIVGDALQIEPVWGVKAVIDNANARSEGLEPKELHATGRAASSGSVIRMAQATTVFSQDFSPLLGREKGANLGKGLYLVEHRRCITPIIEYCNELCYEGILLPKNEGAPTTDLPPMLGVHVQGRAQKAVSGSRYNEFEAYAMAQWLAENKDMLQRTYDGAELKAIVGIVTPFKAQIGKINAALKARGLGDAGITVGTVHALQGAERRIVLFSPVCTAADAQGPLFFNTSPNMLNVAVSRAKENFIIFGDMGLLALVDPRSPYGMFVRYLEFGEASLPDHEVFPEHLRPTCFLQEFSRHDAFFHAVLAHARKAVVVVSPWVTTGGLQPFVPAMEECLAKGVAIHVLVDPNKCENAKNNGLPALEKTGVRVHKASVGMHAKLLICDHHTLACGSFNWLSASRSAQYAQIEQSAVVGLTGAQAFLEDFCQRCHLEDHGIALV